MADSDYVLVEQHVPFVEVHSRVEAGQWTTCDYEGFEAEAQIPSIQCNLKLAEIYRRVQFVGEDAQERLAP